MSTMDPLPSADWRLQRGQLEWQQTRLAVLGEALGGIPVDARRLRTLKWLAEWDIKTVSSIAELVRAARGWGFMSSRTPVPPAGDTGQVLPAADGTDVGVVGRADENRASRAVLVLMVAARSARWRRGEGGRAAVVCMVAPGRGRAGARGSVIFSRRGPGRVVRG